MFEKVVQLEPNSAVDWQHLARLYEKTGQWDEALEAAATALSLQPNFDTAMYEIGLVLSVQGRQDEAVSKLENYLKIYPHSPAVLTLLGSFYLQEGQSSRAEDSLNKALQFVSKGSMLEAWIQSLLGKVALQNGDYPLAAQWVERAVEVTPENVSYLIQLGDLYTLMHQTNKARGIYQQAMNMSPTSAQIAHIQQQLNKLNSP
jgi:superkiller protein 3